MKFAGYRNSKTLIGHYLNDMSNVDGAAAYLGLEPRRDITEDFRSATMGRNPELLQSLPAKLLKELEQRQDYVELCREIEDLSFQIKAAPINEGREELKAQQDRLYHQRRKLRDEEREKYQRGQQRAYNAQSVAHDGGDWRRSYFDRVVRHMVPERDRLANVLTQAAPLRSSQGISTLQDLISLLTNDSRVAYQGVL